MTPKLKFIELNMHRAVEASVELTKQLQLESAVCMLTEPCTHANKVSHVPQNMTCIPRNPLSEMPQVAIMIPRHIPHVSLVHLSNRDCAAVILTTECGKVLLASIYLDYNLDVVPDWLEELVEYADSKKLPLLMAFDSNAHSTLYGPEDNKRGVDFEEFITQNNLLFENRGNQSTFHAFRRGASIDTFIKVTLSKNLILLHDWKIHDHSYNGSDHHTITWFLPTTPPPPPLIRPWLKAKWNVFTEQIAEYNFRLPENLTPYKVDNVTGSLVCCRWGCFGQGLPQKTRKT